MELEDKLKCSKSKYKRTFKHDLDPAVPMTALVGIEWHVYHEEPHIHEVALIAEEV